MKTLEQKKKCFTSSFFRVGRGESLMGGKSGEDSGCWTSLKPHSWGAAYKYIITARWPSLAVFYNAQNDGYFWNSHSLSSNKCNWYEKHTKKEIMSLQLLHTSLCVRLIMLIMFLPNVFSLKNNLHQIGLKPFSPWFFFFFLTQWTQKSFCFFPENEVI